MTTILADAINLGLTKMAESCPGQSSFPLPARRDAGPELRAATPSCQRPHPGHSTYRALEHGLYREDDRCISSERPVPQCRIAEVPVASRLGAHQPDRRLSVARKEARPRQIQAPSHPQPGLACFIVRFLTGPLPVPSWCKELVDAWLRHAGVSDGKVFRRVLKGGKMPKTGRFFGLATGWTRSLYMRSQLPSSAYIAFPTYCA